MSRPVFDGCVIGESLRDPTVINRLDVWRAWTERCGFPDGAEQRLGAMLTFVDVDPS